MSIPNTASAVAAGSLFPAELVPEFINLVKGHSSIAKMSAAAPIPFTGSKEFTFAFDNEVDIVAEAGAKSAGGGTVAAKTIVPIKIEYGMRVSKEFELASEETRLDYLRTFAEGWARKVARGLDIMAMHGVNPRTGSASQLIGTNSFDTGVTNVIEYLHDGTTADANIEEAIALVQASDNEVNGLIMGTTIKGALAALTAEDGRKVYPELAWGNNPGTINGLPVDTNSTVQYNGADARAYVGDFANCFKWGISKDMPIEVIRYGNPDNDSTAGDLAGHNQVYLRGEAFIGWGILDASAFAAVAVQD